MIGSAKFECEFRTWPARARAIRLATHAHTRSFFLQAYMPLKQRRRVVLGQANKCRNSVYCCLTAGAACLGAVYRRFKRMRNLRGNSYPRKCDGKCVWAALYATGRHEIFYVIRRWYNDKTCRVEHRSFFFTYDTRVSIHPWHPMYRVFFLINYCYNILVCILDKQRQKVHVIAIATNTFWKKCRWPESAWVLQGAVWLFFFLFSYRVM